MLMEAATLRLLPMAPRRYSDDFDESIQWKPAFKVEDYVLVGRPSKAAFASYAADEIEDCR